MNRETLLFSFVDEVNRTRRELKILPEIVADYLVGIKIRTNGLIFSDIDVGKLDEDIQEWSHSTMRITALDLDIGFIDIAVASNRINYDLGLIKHALEQFLESY